MKITKFNEKLNYLQNNIYTIEEVLHPVDGVVESVLIHDNIAENTINVYTGSKLTGEKIKTYIISTPSKAPWSTIIKIYSDLDTVYVTYETKGDTVEADDINMLQDSLNETQTAINDETTRATNSETEITNNLNAEISRAKASEKILTDNLASEISRATNKENLLNTSLDGEIRRAKAKESEIDTALNNRYTKSEVFTKEEVLNKIQTLINNAPEVLDTFGEIARALGNDPNFATTITTLLSQKVDKVSGKGLSTNDFDNTQKSNLSDAYNKRHIHDNKSVLDGITSALISYWNNAYTHISDTIKHITVAERTLWNSVVNKLDKSGGSLTGNIIFTNDSEIGWDRNTDFAKIRFKNTSDGDVDSYMEFQTGDNNNEYFKFSHRLSGQTTPAEWMSIKSDHLRYRGNIVYHAGYKPNKNDVGLNNVDNTSDLNKPISTATQNALNGKSNTNHTHTKSQITDFPTSLPANGGTASKLGNAINIIDYNTLVPTKIAQGSITPIKAGSSANSPWSNTTSGVLVQSNDTDSFHILIFRSGGDGWAYRSWCLNKWGSWRIWSTFDGNFNSLSNKPTKLSQFTNDLGFVTNSNALIKGCTWNDLKGS